MLQLINISKKYRTGDLVQQALDGLRLNLRDNEFVAILGPSGSGKTTLLNVIGGLDRYDRGDLIINGTSTKDYFDRDWDSYRNHTIGFVFQSYNLIPHQTILSNVELALTISGFSRGERRKKAKKALEDVGLGDQLHKRPNQLSGGQMQRVAIARALVNDPDILLADEPTGALDTETSLQVMELLKQVAKDRLVVMVTHNPELAESYATRIVRLRDGRITDDSDPYEVQCHEKPRHRNLGRASMSFFTALNLSFQNLRCKKTRTLLTAFAGSIGIIGIGLILSLSNGVSNYITAIQKDTMTSYPITIEAQSVDFGALFGGHAGITGMEHPRDKIYMNSSDLEVFSSITSSVTENDLSAFKAYLDDPGSPIHKFVGSNGIVYSYDVQFGLYTYDPNGELLNAHGEKASAMGDVSPVGEKEAFQELLPGGGGQPVSPVLLDNYEVLYGKWPMAYNEIVMVLSENNEISASALYQLGVLPASEYREILTKLEEGEEVILPERSWTYEELCSKPFYLLPMALHYVQGTDGLYRMVNTDAELEKQLQSGLKLTVCGVIRPRKDADFTPISANLAYTQKLTEYIIAQTEGSPVVRAQRERADTNVLTGVSFIPKDNEAKIQDAKAYISGLGVSDKAALCKEMLSQIYGDNPQMTEQMLTLSEAELADMLDHYLRDPEDQVLLGIYDRYISPGSFDENMEAFGFVNPDAPAAINIYTDSFEAKDFVAQCIADYNAEVAEEDQIGYTDYVALLMSSVTTIIRVISYVLIAFVGVSLVVSSIMIGIITYISVLERTKEIGILRAIGASRKSITLVFNAETFIIGLCAGVMGIVITAVSLIPGNAIIHTILGDQDVVASLPPLAAVILVILSVILTLIGGLIPARKAAKKDPVTALRTD